VELMIALKNSLLLPKKSAVFRLNRISMRNTLVYMFFLIFLALLPDFVIEMFSSISSSQNSGIEVFILQLIVLYPLFCIFLGIVVISLSASIATAIKSLLKRKLAYQQLWKMTVYALTVPLIIYFIISWLNYNHWSIYLLLFVLHYSIMTKMILVYPRRK
jgi:hypothetical protein